MAGGGYVSTQRQNSLGRLAVKFLRPLLIACALLAPSLASAQGFPSQTIRLIVPFPPGGPNDVIARVIAQRMAEILKQTIVIENRSGQAGVFGTDVVVVQLPGLFLGEDYGSMGLVSEPLEHDITPVSAAPRPLPSVHPPGLSQASTERGGLDPVLA